ncbi:MAG: methyltransferase domain-containing protein [Pikeienuella sp.]
MPRADVPSAEGVFRPSAYTAALLRQMLLNRDRFAGANVLDIGCGGGVLLAAAGEMGAARLCGIDIEADALLETERLLATLAPSPTRAVELHRGDLFAPIGERRFDVVLANLPHFPMSEAAVDGRRRRWSSGGVDGRAHLDPFVARLGDRLADGGMAFATHNAFLGIASTKSLAAANGLTLSIVDRVLVPVLPAKLAVMTPAIRARELRQTLHQFGPHAFGEVLVIALTRQTEAAP